MGARVKGGARRELDRRRAWHPDLGGAGVVCALCGAQVLAGHGSEHAGGVYCYPECWVAVGQRDLHRERARGGK